MRIRLIWKFLAVHVVVLIAVIATIWLSIDWLAKGYFKDLMMQFPEFDKHAGEINKVFLEANKDSLLIVGASAVLVAGILCYLVTRRILRPIDSMQKGTERIAVGDYECRIPITTNDELADLSGAFNAMATSLDRVEQLRRGMVVDVAHELRTPLTNLRGFIEAIQDRLVQPTDHVMRTLHSELLRLVRLTEDLLQAARDGERPERPRKTLGLLDLVDETLDLFRPRFTRRGIDIDTEFANLGQNVLADPDQMKQVMSNLLQNCLQYAPENSWMKIRAVERDRGLRLVFSNPGEGIESEELRRIFEPYYRVDKSRSRNTGGAGIGLAIVQSLIESHGGSVGASSADEVTQIWVELPLSAG